MPSWLPGGICSLLFVDAGRDEFLTRHFVLRGSVQNSLTPRRKERKGKAKKKLFLRFLGFLGFFFISLRSLRPA
jgi:hypothetical protein